MSQSTTNLMVASIPKEVREYLLEHYGKPNTPEYIKNVYAQFPDYSEQCLLHWISVIVPYKVHQLFVENRKKYPINME